MSINLSKNQLKILNNNKELFKLIENLFIEKDRLLNKQDIVPLLQKHKVKEKMYNRFFEVTNAKELSKIKIIETKKRVSKKEQRILNDLKRKHRYKQSDTYTLRLKNIKKSYGLKKVLKGVSFDILKGEKVSLVGKNGSGKSTLISIISQQLKMSRGDILYGYASNKVDSFELMGIQFQALLYPEGFIVKDVISFFNSSVEKTKRLSKNELEALIIKFGINKFIGQKIDRLSGGQQQRINILLAMIKRPKLLILDEISTGLDVESSEIIKGYINDYFKENKDASLLLVSHSDEEIREMSTKVFVLEQGKIVEEMKSSKLTKEKFLEITSRKLKLTKKEFKKQEKEEARYLNNFSRWYTNKEQEEPKKLDKYLKKLKSKGAKYSILDIEKGKTTNKHRVFVFFNSIFTLNTKKRNNKSIDIKKISDKPREVLEETKKVDIKISVNVLKNQLKILNNNKELFKLIENLFIKEGRLLEKQDIIPLLQKHKVKEKMYNRFFEITNEKELSKIKIIETKKRESKKEQEKSNLSKKIDNQKQELKNFSKKFVGNIKNENFKEGNIIQINDISKTYGKKVGAVRNVSLEIKDGERISITGPNGSGKTTLVEMISFVKKADNRIQRFRNMKNLAKSDYDNVLKTIKYKKDIELKQFKGMYMFSQELYAKEIAEIKRDTEELVKNSKLSEEKARAKIEKDINFIKEKMAKELALKEKEYKELEIALNKKSEVDVNEALKEYNKEKANILLERSKNKKTNGDFVVPGYILNGKKVKEQIKNIDDPQISYSFAKTIREVKDRVGVQFQYVSFPFDMTVQDVILFFSRSNKFFLNKAEMINAIKVFKLERLLKSRANRLSGGEKQRLNVLLAIMKSPKVLILDEISTGLDVDSIVRIDKFIKEYLAKTKATLILISHNYHEVHSLTDKIVVMERGQLKEIMDKKGWNLMQTKEKMKDIYKGGNI